MLVGKIIKAEEGFLVCLFGEKEIKIPIVFSPQSISDFIDSKIGLEPISDDTIRVFCWNLIKIKHFMFYLNNGEWYKNLLTSAKD